MTTTLLLSRHDPSFVDTVFGCLLDAVFEPAIRAFRSLSSRLLADLLGSSGPVADVRHDVLRVFGMLVSGVRVEGRGLGAAVSELGGSLVLEAVRELECAVFGGDDERVAAKDTVWYLCAVMHMVADGRMDCGRVRGRLCDVALEWQRRHKEARVLMAGQRRLPSRAGGQGGPDGGPCAGCGVDEGGLAMLLGVVERYVLQADLGRSGACVRGNQGCDG